ncbi:response regulator [Altererythrobacter xixiisoli]|uniref:Response regulator n=1 Tax=Croceibacterium xixiisoli TaxID=1476466 RepID=A0A6I4TUU2_9SPHN|nr:response regulator [Croceibacterium xixiisoli]
MKALVVEDDEKTRSFIVRGLRQAGHVVDEAASGDAGLDLALDGTYDVLILDRMLPAMAGLDILRAVREAGVASPCLILTALGAVEDRVEGLNAGADDYLVKPFAFSELLARLQALERRPPLASRQADVLLVGDLAVDPGAHRVTRAGQLIDLTSHEFKLLEFLARRTGQVVTRTMLLEALWGFHFDPKTNIVDAHISRLRSKVDKAFDTELIRTVRGVGYVLQEPR